MPWNPVNAVTAGLSGGLLAHAAIALLCGIPPTDPGYRFGLNLMVPVIRSCNARIHVPTAPHAVRSPVPTRPS